MRRRVALFLILFSVLGTIVPLRAFALDDQVRLGLQKLLDAVDEDHKKLDTQLTDALKDMQNTEVNSGKAYLLETTLLTQETKVTSIRDQLAKNHQVIEFLNDFISAMEPAKDARAEAPKFLLDMMHKQLSDSAETGQDSKVWLFEMNLSIAIKEFMEPSEKFADFIHAFLGDKADLEKPISLSEFMEKRKYINAKPSGPYPNPTED